jgi:hypothetical protein
MEAALDVELPAEDLRELRHDARGHAGGGRVLAEAALDPPAAPFTSMKYGSGARAARMPSPCARGSSSVRSSIS